MTATEIIILILGFVLLVCSFFFGEGKNQTESLDLDEEIKKIKEAAVYQEEEVRRKLEELLANASEKALADVEDKLAQVSNDKIMAVDEFSNQVLEKIENNNQEIIFLYDMLQKKEEEMKSTMNKMEQMRRENKELFDRIEELKQAKARVSSRNAAKKQGELPQMEDQISKAGAQPGKEQTAVNTAEEKTEEPEEELIEAAETPEDKLEKQEKVLALYAEEKSIKEISKMLSMGQGAVKLIIDLYGKK